MAALSLDSMMLDINGVARDEEVTRVILDPRDAEGGTLTFFKARQGGVKVWYTKVTVVQDLATGSLQRLALDNPGSWYAFRAAPYGNKTASASQPHVLGEVKLDWPGDFIGNEASQDDGNPTFEAEWKLRGSSTVPLITFVTTGTMADASDRD